MPCPLLGFSWGESGRCTDRGVISSMFLSSLRISYSCPLGTGLSLARAFLALTRLGYVE